MLLECQSILSSVLALRRARSVTSPCLLSSGAAQLRTHRLLLRAWFGRELRPPPLAVHVNHHFTTKRGDELCVVSASISGIARSRPRKRERENLRELLVPFVEWHRRPQRRPCKQHGSEVLPLLQHCQFRLLVHEAHFDEGPSSTSAALVFCPYYCSSVPVLCQCCCSVPGLCQECASIAPALCQRCATTLPLLYHVWATILPQLCNYFATIAPPLCHYGDRTPPLMYPHASMRAGRHDERITRTSSGV